MRLHDNIQYIQKQPHLLQITRPDSS